MLARLRAATAAAHQELEGHPRLARLLAPELTRAEYTGILARLYGFYRPLEDQLAACRGLGELGLTPGSIVRAGVLAADLTDLEVDPTTVPLCAAVPAPRDAAAGLGVLYVCAGASLGGRIIARRVRASRAGAGCPTGFFDASGLATEAPVWPRFLAVLQRQGPALVATGGDQAASAALATFTGLGAWLTA